MENEIKRGDVWLVSEQLLMPGVLGLDRPALVISSDVGNLTSDAVAVLYMSTAKRRECVSINVPVRWGGRDQYVLCNQVQTIHRNWLRVRRGALPAADMRKVEQAFMTAMGLYPKEIADAAEAAQREQEQKYEAALQIIRQQQVLLDAMKVSAVPQPVPAVISETPCAVLGKFDDMGRLNINRATADELRDVGLTETNISSILYKRPFRTLDDVRVYLRLTDSTFRQMQSTCCVLYDGNEYGPLRMIEPSVEPEPKVGPAQPEAAVSDVLHVRSATVAETQEFLLARGFRPSHVQGFRSALLQYHKIMGGPAASVADLDESPRFTKKTKARLLVLEEGGEVVFD